LSKGVWSLEWWKEKENWNFIGVIMAVTLKVKGYNRFVGKYVSGRKKRFILDKDH